jgi:hypothetical protein
MTYIFMDHAYGTYFDFYIFRRVETRRYNIGRAYGSKKGLPR